MRAARAHRRGGSAWHAGARALACAALAVAGVLAWVPSAGALTEVAEYRARVAEAKAAVEAYIATGAEEGGGDTAIAVLTALPPAERVGVG